MQDVKTVTILGLFITAIEPSWLLCVCTVYWKSSGVLCNVWLLTSLSEHCSVQVRCVLSDHQSAVCLLNWEESNQLWKVNHHHTSFNNDFPIQTIQLCQDTNLGICLPF